MARIRKSGAQRRRIAAMRRSEEAAEAAKAAKAAKAQDENGVHGIDNQQEVSNLCTIIYLIGD